MKILFDIMHPAHINFFKNMIRICREQGHEVVITVLNRGKVPSIVRRELPDEEVHVIGRHRGTRYSILMEANILRFLRMFAFLLRRRPDIGLSVGSFVAGMGFRLLGRRNYQVDDDPERFWNVALEKFTATRLFFPEGISDNHPRISNFNCLKEWAYLSPRYFEPNAAVLEPYGVREREYIFIREVSTGSLNYMNQAKNPVASISGKFPPGYKVLLSLEDKSTREQYPAEWIVLREPVEDIHSLMYFSKCVVSSGDSMAREGAMLGVPAVYCGSRDMRANQVLIDRQMLHHLSPDETVRFLHQLAAGEAGVEDQHRRRQALLAEWDDINYLLLREIGITQPQPLNATLS